MAATAPTDPLDAFLQSVAQHRNRSGADGSCLFFVGAPTRKHPNGSMVMTGVQCDEEKWEAEHSAIPSEPQCWRGGRFIDSCCPGDGPCPRRTAAAEEPILPSDFREAAPDATDFEHREVPSADPMPPQQGTEPSSNRKSARSIDVTRG
jgi:hypothetical protein